MKFINTAVRASNLALLMGLRTINVVYSENYQKLTNILWVKILSSLTVNPMA
jgi:hypothetical protein